MTGGWRAALLGLRFGIRELRSGELATLALALSVAMASVTAVALFVDRLEQALALESSGFLGADRRLTASDPLPRELFTDATSRGLATAEVVDFPTMAYAGERHLLVSVKAVDGSYPLRGVLRTARRPWQESGHEVVQRGPAAGEVWLESRALPMLDVQVGDQIELGRAAFVVARVLISEPDRPSGLLGPGPRAMVHRDDLAAMDVIHPGSRVRWRLLLAGAPAVLAAFRNEVVDAYPASDRWRWEGIREANRSVGSALERAERFLSLGGLLALALAMIAVGMSAWRFAVRQTDGVAVLKALGAGPGQVRMLYGALIIALGGGAAALGLLVGYLTHLGILAGLGGLLEIDLPPAGWTPWFVGAFTGLVCVAGFALPPLFALARVPPMLVIRRIPGGQLVSPIPVAITGLLVVVALLRWYAGEWLLGLWAFSGVLVAVGAFAIVASFALRVGRVAGARAGSVYRLAFGGLQRRVATTIVQVSAFAVAIMLLLVLTLLRTALIDDWQRQIPVDTPNHFMINIDPVEEPAVRAELETVASAPVQMFPMLRGRVVTVNDVAAVDWAETHGDPGAAAPDMESERNLGHAATLPPDNKILSGRWWPEETAGLASIEQNYARRAGLSVGDRIEVDAGGRRFTSTVASIRSVRWDNLRPNFYILFSPKTLGDLPVTYMTGVFIQGTDKQFLAEFLRRFPTVVVIETDVIIAQVRRIVERVSSAVEFVLALVVASGIVVLVASVQASMDERLHEQAVLRALGAGGRRLRGALLLEFSAIGLFAGLIAAAGAELSVMLLQTQMFNLESGWHPWLFAVGPALGVVLVVGVGMWVTRRVVTVAPVTVLREIQGTG